MALATRCPHCQTTFRVAQDQLKIRAGIVRCGTCKQIFNGVEHLIASEEMVTAKPPVASQASASHDDTASGAPAPETVAKAEAPQHDYGLDIAVDIPVPMPAALDLADDAAREDEFPAPPGDAEACSPTGLHTDVGNDDDTKKPDQTPIQDRIEVGAVPIAAEAELESHAPDGTDCVAQAAGAADEEDTVGTVRIDAYFHEPETSEAAVDAPLTVAAPPEEAANAPEDEIEEPAFVKRGRKKQRMNRALRIFMTLASLVLFVGMLAQATYAWRVQIAAWLPQSKPALLTACAHLGCQIGLPMQIDALSIELGELTPLPQTDNTFVYTTLLRNHGKTVQAWPYVELVLNDASEKTLLRRALVPREYLESPQDAARGIAAKAEQVVKVYFELKQLKASGFRVHIFYP